MHILFYNPAKLDSGLGKSQPVIVIVVILLLQKNLNCRNNCIKHICVSIMKHLYRRNSETSWNISSKLARHRNSEHVLAIIKFDELLRLLDSELGQGHPN